MSAQTRVRFIVSQQVAPAIINALINGWIAWGMHREPSAVELWGDGGYATDLIATGVLLPGITWLIVHPMLRKQAAAGKAPVTDGVPVPRLAPFLPAGFWSGAAVIGAVGGGIGLLMSGLMHLLGAPSFSGGEYAWFKGLYGGLLPVLLQPSMVFAILGRAVARAA